MVSASLLGIVLTCMYLLLTAGMRYHKATSASLEMQQDTLLAILSLSRELGESNPRTLARHTSPQGLLFGSPRDDAANVWVDPSGLVRWPKFICYYVDSVNGTPCLVRKEQYMDDPDLHTDPPPIAAPIPKVWQDGPYYRQLEVPGKVVARNITNFQCLGTNPVKINLGVGKKELGRKFQLDVSVKVSLRN
jgi:hypothetical protein